MFTFKKKQYNENVDKIYSFYIENMNYIDSMIEENMSQKRKKELVNELYKMLFTDKTGDLQEKDIKVYRGITADTEDNLNKYIKDFFEGNINYGLRASIYGTGVYTCLGDNMKVAINYASNGDTTSCGVVIESTVIGNIANYEELIASQEKDISNLNSKTLNKKYKMFIEMINDVGLYAGILGYDAIYVPDKEYVVILNTKIVKPINFKYINQFEDINSINTK